MIVKGGIWKIRIFFIELPIVQPDWTPFNLGNTWPPKFFKNNCAGNFELPIELPIELP